MSNPWRDPSLNKYEGVDGRIVDGYIQHKFTEYALSQAFSINQSGVIFPHEAVGHIYLRTAQNIYMIDVRTHQMINLAASLREGRVAVVTLNARTCVHGVLQQGRPFTYSSEEYGDGNTSSIAEIVAVNDAPQMDGLRGVLGTGEQSPPYPVVEAFRDAMRSLVAPQTPEDAR